MADSTFEPEISRSLKYLDTYYPVKHMVPLAIECKKKETPYLEFALVKKHQIEGLIEFRNKPFHHKVRVGSPIRGSKRRFTATTPFDFVYAPTGLGFLVVNFRFTKRSPRSDIEKGTNRCFAVTPYEWLEGVEHYKNLGGSSVNYDWFCEKALELDRFKWGEKGAWEYGWDLRPLFTYKSWIQEG